jgi:hypothetical protein
MSKAYQLASEKAEKNAKSWKVQYDKKANSTSLQPGHHVSIRNVKESGGPGSLQESVQVRQKSNEIPVYVVIPESGVEKTKVLHKNLLFPCTYLPVENPVVKPAQLKNEKKSEKEKQVTQDYLTDSEDEFEIAAFAPELTQTDPEDKFVPVSAENEADQSDE